MEPITRREIYLAYAAGDTSLTLPEPVTREEKYLYEIATNGGGSGTGGVAGVSSFKGRTGAVVPATGDYTPEMVGADPAGSANSALSAAKVYTDENIAGKQDALKGTAGQYVGFDDEGNAVPVNAPSGDGSGEPGIGIQSLTQTTTSTESGGLNEWTVTLTDGSQSVLQVRNGQQGTPGKDGSDGAPGADGKDGQDGNPGADGFSPTITENAGNSQTSYKLDITDVNGTRTTPNLQAVSFVENADVYSTDETIIGQWIDGKPIYRKVYQSTIPAATTGTATSNYISVNVSVDHVLSLTGVAVDSTGTHAMPLSTITDLMSGMTRLIYEYSSARIRIVNYQMAILNSASIYIVFEYTKTTDTATYALPTAAAMEAAYEEGVQSA